MRTIQKPVKHAPIRYDLKTNDRVYFPEEKTTFEVIDSFPNGVNLRGIHSDDNENTFFSYVRLSSLKAVRVISENKSL